MYIILDCGLKNENYSALPSLMCSAALCTMNSYNVLISKLLIFSVQTFRLLKPSTLYCSSLAQEMRFALMCPRSAGRRGSLPNHSPSIPNNSPLQVHFRSHLGLGAQYPTEGTQQISITTINEEGEMKAPCPYLQREVERDVVSGAQVL